jgi:outer membrane immunogenic protein
MRQAALGLLLASIAGAAFAADMSTPSAPPYAKAPLVSPATNWSGFYIGAVGGYGSEATSDPQAAKGGFGGGTLGYNWQYGTFVFGVEADDAFGDVSSSVASPDFTATAKIDNLATVRGRVGVAFDQVLLYGTGGVAWADTKYSFSGFGLTLNDNHTQTGWVAGAGVEWMFMPRWSLKAEYLYRRFDNLTIFGNSGGDSLAVNSGEVGINYHF